METSPPDAGPRYGLLDPAALAAIAGLDFLRGLVDGSMPAPPFAEVADVAPLTADNGRVVFMGTPSRRFYNPMGMIHGGWISLLLDTAMGCAVHSALPAGHAFATIEMKTVYARALREEHGPVTCEPVLLHRGGQLASAEGQILDREGRLVAHGSETCFIRALSAGSGQ